METIRENLIKKLFEYKLAINPMNCAYILRRDYNIDLYDENNKQFKNIVNDISLDKTILKQYHDELNECKICFNNVCDLSRCELKPIF